MSRYMDLLKCTAKWVGVSAIGLVVAIYAIAFLSDQYDQFMEMPDERFVMECTNVYIGDGVYQLPYQDGEQILITSSRRSRKTTGYYQNAYTFVAKMSSMDSGVIVHTWSNPLEISRGARDIKIVNSVFDKLKLEKDGFYSITAPYSIDRISLELTRDGAKTMKFPCKRVDPKPYDELINKTQEAFNDLRQI